jgi:hypothetical protein
VLSVAGMLLRRPKGRIHGPHRSSLFASWVRKQMSLKPRSDVLCRRVGRSNFARDAPSGVKQSRSEWFVCIVFASRPTGLIHVASHGSGESSPVIVVGSVSGSCFLTHSSIHSHQAWIRCLSSGSSVCARLRKSAA